MHTYDLLPAQGLRNADPLLADLLRGSALEQAVAACLVTQAAAGRAPKTLAQYAGTLPRFAAWMAAQGFPTDDLTAIQAVHLNLFLADCREHPRRRNGANDHPLAPASVHHYGRALRFFFNFLVDEGHLARNPMLGARPGKLAVPLPRTSPPLIRPFSEAQIEALLAGCDRTTPLGTRDAAILLVGLDTGLRVSELCRLALAAYSPLAGTGTVQGSKGGGERRYILGPPARRALNSWLAWRAGYGTPPDTLFVSLGGHSPGPLTEDGVRAMLARRGQAAGISGVRCSPHTLRHTFACYYLRNGGDRESLRQLMGHTTVAMAERYLQGIGEHLEEFHRRFSPSARINTSVTGKAAPHRADHPGRGGHPPARTCWVCADAGEQRPVKARGLCTAHHQRWLTTGDVAAHIPLQGRRKEVAAKACEVCGTPIPPATLRHNPGQRYCGAACARTARYGRQE